MSQNEYYKQRAIELENELNTLADRSANESDIVLKEMACNMFDQRRGFLRNHARRNPMEFAKLIADGIIGSEWISYLSRHESKVRPLRKDAIDILRTSAIPEVLEMLEWHIK